MLIFFLNFGFYYNDVEYRHKRREYNNRQHISIKKSLIYGTYDGIIWRDPVNNVGIESVGSAGQTSFTYQALVWRVTKHFKIVAMP